MRMFAGWLLLGSSIALADEDPPPPQEEPTQDAQTARFQLEIRSGGQYVLDGEPISRDALRDLIASDAGRAGHWSIQKSPQAASHTLSSVTDLLSRAGVTAVEVTTTAPQTAPVEAPASSPVIATPAPTIMVAPATPITPIADVRFGGSATGLSGDEALEVGFVASRVAAGAHAMLGEHTEATILLEAAEMRGESSTGFLVRPRDAWVSFPLTPSGQLTARVGVQPALFGTQTWFNDDVDGFYTVSRSFQTVTLLSGLHNTRVMGASATARFQEDRGTVSLMLSNASDSAKAEDNNGKDTALRLQYRVVDPVTVVLSGSTGPRNVDDSGRLTAGDLAIRLDQGPLDALVEGVIGTDDDGTGAAEVPTFLGTNVAAGVSIPLPPDMLDTVRIAARLAYFDPALSTADADAWMLTGAGVLVRWATAESTRLLSGLGYEIYTPMDATLPINHRALVETHFQF
jgi:biopolymer transport protein ExbD